MAPTRRQSTSKAPTTGITTPSTVSTPQPPPRLVPSSKLKIHPVLEAYDAAISALIATLGEDPYRPETTAEAANKLVQSEAELEDALDESTLPLPSRIRPPFLTLRNLVEEGADVIFSEETSGKHLENTTFTAREYGIIEAFHSEFDKSIRSPNAAPLPP
jgi:hypothetical protein